MRCRTGQERRQSPGCVNSCTNPRARCTGAPVTQKRDNSQPVSSHLSTACCVPTTTGKQPAVPALRSYICTVLSPVLHIGERTQERDKSMRSGCKEREGGKASHRRTDGLERELDLHQIHREEEQGVPLCPGDVKTGQPLPGRARWGVWSKRLWQALHVKQWILLLSEVNTFCAES